jgi:ethanolamine utilization protein EutQ (cupin superfamily)
MKKDKMSKIIQKVAAKDIKLQPVIDVPRWKGSNISEIFDTSGKTRMACGIHEIFKSETIEADRVVDDLLYILDGEIEIRTDKESEVFKAGDFAYVPAKTTVTYAVNKYVKLIYIVYPASWKSE